MTASWCRRVAGPGVLRDSIKPIAQEMSDHDVPHRDRTFPHRGLPIDLADR
jgi:hypothetical protein